eukprot:scaffold112937_cov116-Cyclotella_meneghiniana.AAC.1
MSNKDALLEQAAISAAGLQQSHVLDYMGLTPTPEHCIVCLLNEVDCGWISEGDNCWARWQNYRKG